MKTIDFKTLGYNPKCGSWDIYLNLDANKQYSEHGLSRLNKGYMHESEPTPQHRLANVARLLATDEAHAQRMYSYMSKLWYSPSTPQLAYGRTPLGQPIACYLPHLGDTAESLVEVSNEAKVMNMLGGGVGVGMFIRGAAGKSTGIMPHAKTYDADIVAYQQQGTRRGAVAVYCRIDHPDIEQFLVARVPGGDDKFKLHKAYQGVILTNEFMTRLEALRKGGTTAEQKAELDRWELKHPAQGVTAVVSVRKLAQALISARVEHQQPFIMFEDNANGADEWLYNATSHVVTHSNLCVAPETLVLTNKGHEVIKDLENQEVTVWNGMEFSNTVVRKTSDSSKLIKVTLANGLALECTPYHKWYIEIGNTSELKEIRAHELTVGDKVVVVGEASRDARRFETVVSITDEGRTSETYCFTEPLRGKGVFNGVLTGNCSEIILSTSPDHSAVCVLGSCNAEKFDEWETSATFIGDVTEFLDNSITVFSRNIRNLGDEFKSIRESMMKAVRGAELERSIGIGLLGFGSYLQSRFIPFSSIVAVSLARKIQSHIAKKANARSFNLGFSRGFAPMYDLLPQELKNDPLINTKIKRNVKLLAIAPNASSSIILDTSPSIEPYCANVYLEKGSAGSHTRWNKNLVKYLDKLGFSEEKLREIKLSIIDNQGSVQHLPELSDKAKDVFKCAHEVDQRDLVRIAAARQEFIDQAQSFNMFITADTDISYIVDLHILAWKQGLKTIYYIYRSSVGKVSILNTALPTIDLDATCIACE